MLSRVQSVLHEIFFFICICKKLLIIWLQKPLKTMFSMIMQTSTYCKSNFCIDESENHSSDRLITLAFVYEVRVTLLLYWMKTDIVFSLNQTVSMETVVFHNSIRNKGGG